jgi:hypothetical protein
MNAICRSCDMDKSKHLSGPMRHRLVDVGLICPMCNHDGEWSSHLHDELWGDSLECIICHNYILYVSPENQIWKDEIYLSKGRYLIRNLEHNTSTLYANATEICEVEHIMQFESPLQLENKIQTMVVFS